MSRFRTRELEKSGGHGESSSGLGTVRSKISSMVSAGTLQPIVERGLRRLQHALMNPIAACLAESLGGKLRLQYTHSRARGCAALSSAHRDYAVGGLAPELVGVPGGWV